VHEEVGVDVTDLAISPASLGVPAFADDRLYRALRAAACSARSAEIADVRWFRVEALPDLPSPRVDRAPLIDTTAARLRGEPGTTPVG
jgi:NADH pyrophosphatase NudC (nudix superfamily)